MHCDMGIIKPTGPQIRMDKGSSLVVQWLELHTFTAEGAGSIPGWGTKIPQARKTKNKNEKNKRTNKKCPGGCEEIRTFVLYWWECKMVPLLWKIAWLFLKKTKHRITI